jgi:lambda repressor-like predicted transcriptional regulator
MVKKPKREIDWHVLIEKLQKEGITMGEMSTITGIKPSVLSGIYNESYSKGMINGAINLMLLFLANTDDDLPILGDHYIE